jgi:hypothetical protein
MNNGFKTLIWFNRLAMVLIYFIMFSTFIAVSMIEIGSLFLLCAIGCILLLGAGCFAIQILEEINKELKNGPTL